MIKPYTIICEDTEQIPRKDWLALRKSAVCASDFPMLLGLGYKTAVELFLDKTTPVLDEELSADQDFRFAFGHALEPVVHQAIATQIGAIPVRDKRMYESTRFPYMRADLDGLFLMQQDSVIQGVSFKKGDVLLFEGKTTNNINFSDWRSAPAPMHMLQAKFGMLIRGLQYAIVGICKGNDLRNDLVYHLVPLLKEDEERIPTLCKSFFEHHVIPRVPPTEVLGSDASAFKKALVAYFSSRQGSISSSFALPIAARQAIENSLSIRDEVKELNALVREKESQRDKIDVPLVAMLGDSHMEGVLESMYATFWIGYQTSRTEQISTDSLARLKTEFPDIYAKLKKSGIITERVTNTFKVKKTEKKAATRKKRCSNPPLNQIGA